MARMFYRYDHDIKDPKPHYRKPEKPERPLGTANIGLIKNIKGEEQGIWAKEGSTFTLYFTFDGVVDDMSLPELLREADFSFGVYDKKHHLLYSAPVIIYPEDCMASVDIVSEVDGLLKYGNYGMRLMLIIDQIAYTLFDENDGILSIN